VTGSRGERTQVEEDAFQAWVYARNCLLYETDRGPALLNVGSEREPRLIPRSEAWQHAYAMQVLVKCNGDHARLTAAAGQCREDLARKAPPPGSPHAQALSRGADLCDQAACACRKLRPCHATSRYSWISPATRACLRTR
jgi:hypothetical protein